MDTSQTAQRTPVLLAIERLQAEHSSLGHEIDALTDELGTAVLHSDELVVQELEERLDALTARRAGISVELTQLQRAVRSDDGRERRRREAAERVQHELMNARAELYSGWGEMFEHRARIVDLRTELQRLESTTPVPMDRLEALETRLRSSQEEIDSSTTELEGCVDVDRLRDAARHYRELAALARQPAAKTVPEPVNEEPEPVAVAEHGLPIESTEAVNQNETSADAAESPDEEIQRLDAERQRLMSLKASLNERGDPMGVASEVDAQLASIAATRTALENASTSNGSNGSHAQDDDPERSSGWLRHLKIGGAR